jgi:hypothetical protein
MVVAVTFYDAARGLQTIKPNNFLSSAATAAPFK